VPTLPFLALVWLPALVRVGRSGWRWALVGFLAVVSGAIQVLGVAVRVDRFFDMVMYEWGWPVYDQRLFFDVAWSPLRWQPYLALGGDLSPAWLGCPAALLPPLALLALTLLVLVCRGSARLVVRGTSRALASVVLLGCLLAPLGFVAILAAHPQPPRPAYRDLTATLDGLAEPEDGIVLNASTRTPVLLDTLRVVSPVLGLHEEGALSPESQSALEQFAAAHRRLWLVSDETVPAAQMQQWLGERGYRALTTDFEPAALTLYGFPAQEPKLSQLDATLGGCVTLLSGGLAEQVAPGDVLPVRLEWRPAAGWNEAEDLHLLLQLLDGSGVLLAQKDRALLRGSQAALRLGLLLPDDVAPGSARLEALVYRESDGLRLAGEGGEEAVQLGVVEITRS
jgi:hypothetical protein